MAERLDGVLSELLAAQANEPSPTPEVPNTDPAAEGGNETIPEEVQSDDISSESTPDEVQTEEEISPIPAEETPAESGEVPQMPTVDPQIDALAKATEALTASQAEVGQLRAMMEQMQNLMMQQQKAQQEANKANEEAIASATLEPPTLDFERVQYLDDAERTAELSKYYNAMAEYTRQVVMKDLQPVVDQYNRQTKEAADAAVKNQLISSGRFEGFSDEAEHIENIIRSTPGLAELPPETKYALGYVINRGVKAMNAKPAAPETTEQLVARVLKNPEAMKAIEKERVTKLAQANKSAPPIAASQGQSNAPAISPNPPKTLDEARAKALKIFGLR